MSWSFLTTEEIDNELNQSTSSASSQLSTPVPQQTTMDRQPSGLASSAAVVPPPPGILPSSVGGPMAVSPVHGEQQHLLYAMPASTMAQNSTPSAFSANAPPLVFPSSENVAMYGPAAGSYTSSQQFAHQQRYQQQQAAAAAAVDRYYPPLSGASSASIGTPQSAKSGASSTSKYFPTGGQQQQIQQPLHAMPTSTMAQTRAPCSAVTVGDLRKFIASTKTRINNETKKLRDVVNKDDLWRAFIAGDTYADTLKNINEMSGVAPAEPTQPQTTSPNVHGAGQFQHENQQQEAAAHPLSAASSSAHGHAPSVEPLFPQPFISHHPHAYQPHLMGQNSASAVANQTPFATEAGAPVYFLPYYYPDLSFTELSQPSTSSVSDQPVELPPPSSAQKRQRGKDEEPEAKRRRDDERH